MLKYLDDTTIDEVYSNVLDVVYRKQGAYDLSQENDLHLEERPWNVLHPMFRHDVVVNNVVYPTFFEYHKANVNSEDLVAKYIAFFDSISYIRPVLQCFPESKLNNLARFTYTEYTPYADGKLVVVEGVPIDKYKECIQSFRVKDCPLLTLPIIDIEIKNEIKNMLDIVHRTFEYLRVGITPIKLDFVLDHAFYVCGKPSKLVTDVPLSFVKEVKGACESIETRKFESMILNTSTNTLDKIRANYLWINLIAQRLPNGLYCGYDNLYIIWSYMTHILNLRSNEGRSDSGLPLPSFEDTYLAIRNIVYIVYLLQYKTHQTTFMFNARTIKVIEHLIGIPPTGLDFRFMNAQNVDKDEMYRRVYEDITVNMQKTLEQEGCDTSLFLNQTSVEDLISLIYNMAGRIAEIFSVSLLTSTSLNKVHYEWINANREMVKDRIRKRVRFFAV